MDNKTYAISLISPLFPKQLRYFQEAEYSDSYEQNGKNIITAYIKLYDDKSTQPEPTLCKAIGFIHFVCNKYILPFSGEGICMKILLYYKEYDDTNVFSPEETMIINSDEKYQKERKKLLQDFVEKYIRENKYRNKFIKFIETMKSEDRLSFLNLVIKNDEDTRNKKIENMFEYKLNKRI